MKRCPGLVLLALLGVVCIPSSANAADRVRAGKWVGTTVAGGKTYPSSSCITQSDADAMNGDAKAVKTYLETVIPPQICKLTDVKVSATQIVYTATCGGQAPRVVTTSYFGDRSEGTDSAGSRTDAKLVGVCK